MVFDSLILVSDPETKNRTDDEILGLDKKPLSNPMIGN